MDTQPKTKAVSLGDLEAEIVERLGGRTKTVVGNTIRLFLNAVAREVAAGSIVTVRPFGSFDAFVSKRKARTNPFRPTETLPAKTEIKVRFRAGAPMHKKAQRLLGEVV